MPAQLEDVRVQTEVVVLPVGRDRYAVPIGGVREVVAAPAVTRLATAGPTVLGLLNLRGEIVPLFDTAALLGIGEVPVVEFAAVLLTPLGAAALAATGLPQRALLDSPGGPSELAGTAGVHHVLGHPTVLLDPAVLLAPERRGAPAPHDPPPVGR